LKYIDVPNIRIVVCGGDGTMGWLLSCIDRVTHGHATNKSLPIAMMPLGTGNDLARSFRWGAGYSSRMAKKQWLKKVASAKTARLDRWRVKIFPTNFASADVKEHLPPILSIHKTKRLSHPALTASGGAGSGVKSKSLLTGTSSLGVTQKARAVKIADTLRRGTSVRVITLQTAVRFYQSWW
jgi:hypothetical protein